MTYKVRDGWGDSFSKSYKGIYNGIPFQKYVYVSNPNCEMQNLDFIFLGVASGVMPHKAFAKCVNRNGVPGL